MHFISCGANARNQSAWMDQDMIQSPLENSQSDFDRIMPRTPFVHVIDIEHYPVALRLSHEYFCVDV